MSRWVPVYLHALESGAVRREAASIANVSRHSIAVWRGRHPEFGHDEQMAVDRGFVTRLIAKLDKRGET